MGKKRTGTDRNDVCILCHDTCTLDSQNFRLRPLTNPVITCCLKYIPNEINETVDWNKLAAGGNSFSRLCNECHRKIEKLSNFDTELVEIQRKITELVNCIVLHIEKKRKETNRNSQSKSDEILESDNFQWNSTCSGSDAGEIKPNLVEVESLSDIIISAIDKPGTWNEDKEPVSENARARKVPKCSTCHKTFGNYKSLHKHDCDKPLPLCDICGLSSLTLSRLKRHFRFHSQEKCHKCEKCGKTFLNKGTLYSHIRLHAANRQTEFECDICHKKFPRRALCKNHKDVVHAEEALFRCEICEKSFKGKRYLQQHMVVHASETDKTIYKCDICDKILKHPLSIYSHKKNYHSGESPHDCRFCEKSYYSLAALRTHELKHTGEKPFPCCDCDKRFRSKESLKSHQWTHMDMGSFDCKTCGKVFKNTQLLKWHLRTCGKKNPTTSNCDPDSNPSQLIDFEDHSSDGTMTIKEEFPELSENEPETILGDLNIKTEVKVEDEIIVFQ